MSAAKRFEELRMWQFARRLANLIYKLTEQPSFRDSDLRRQMRRAAVSAMSNLAEGFGRGSNEELLYFLYIARGSVAELQSQLYLSSDLGYVTQQEFQEAYQRSDETSRLMQAFARSLKRTGKASFRHKRELTPWRERVEQVMKEIEAGSKES